MGLLPCGLARGRRNSDLRGRFRGEKVLHASSLDAEFDVRGVGWGDPCCL